jgi:hypothetical protein
MINLTRSELSAPRLLCCFSTSRLGSPPFRVKFLHVLCL